MGTNHVSDMNVQILNGLWDILATGHDEIGLVIVVFWFLLAPPPPRHPCALCLAENILAMVFEVLGDG